jgi:DNA polymerase-4
MVERVLRRGAPYGAAPLLTHSRSGTLKIKYTDFRQIARSLSLPREIKERTALERIALDLLKGQFSMTKGIRLLGITISAFAPADPTATGQLPLSL